MQSRVNDKCCTIDGHGSMHDLAMMIDQQQVTDSHVAKAQAEWVDPKVISEFGVTNSDVSSHAFTKTHAPKNTKGASEARLTIGALFFDIVEGWHCEQIGVATESGCFQAG
jgi:hypothetical protein